MRERKKTKKTARRTLYLFAAELDVRRYFVRNTFARRQFRKVSPGLADFRTRAPFPGRGALIIHEGLTASAPLNDPTEIRPDVQRPNLNPLKY